MKVTFIEENQSEVSGGFSRRVVPVVLGVAAVALGILLIRDSGVSNALANPDEGSRVIEPSENYTHQHMLNNARIRSSKSSVPMSTKYPLSNLIVALPEDPELNATGRFLDDYERTSLLVDRVDWEYARVIRRTSDSVLVDAPDIENPKINYRARFVLIEGSWRIEDLRTRN